MKRVGLFLCVAAGLALGCATSKSTAPAQDAPDPHGPKIAGAKKGALPEGCDPTDHEMRYPEVEALFTAHCGSCHTRARDVNEKAQAVFESTTYPFTTNQPEKLLVGLDEQFRTRRGLDDAERCLVLQWLHSGARDAAGNPPPYTPL